MVLLSCLKWHLLECRCNRDRTACRNMLQEEGIVVKSLNAPWKANDRSGAWIKIKPDYVHHAEVDAIIIGAHYGAGRRAGDIAEYLLALQDQPRPGQDKPDTFISFCRFLNLHL